MKKTVITVTGIRPDFIRMSQIFKKLDENFKHILIHTGQHFNHLLSDVFFDELDIRKPDYNLEIGGYGKEHFHQTSELSVKIIELLRTKDIKPDLIIFLGDSNSVVCSVPLKKEGYKIAHIEAGMRSGDRRMLEEINRIVCDHCSDFLFVYHENYSKKLEIENIKNNVHVVGNTIVEVVNKFIPTEPKKNELILIDIHRPENFKHKKRLENIIKFANQVGEIYNLPVFMLNFPRTTEFINNFNIDIGKISLIDLLSFKNYIKKVYHSKLLISDSGTAQEEPVFLGTPVLVPRDFTERPESVKNKCSYMIDVNELNNSSIQECIEWVQNEFIKNDKDWLGDGSTSEKIIEILKKEL